MSNSDTPVVDGRSKVPEEAFENLTNKIESAEQGQETAPVERKRTQWDDLVDHVIRPPRHNYSMDQLEIPNTTRVDVKVKNSKDRTLEGSLYYASSKDIKEISSEGCVICCHGNAGSRVDARTAVITMSPKCAVFAFDFSGSGHSEGAYVTLGWNERHDLDDVVKYLTAEYKFTKFALWGHSMGGAASLLYISSLAEGHLIKAVICDSAFSSLPALIKELVLSRVPNIPNMLLSMAMASLKQSIIRRAGFNLKNVDPVKELTQSRVKLPLLLIHAQRDEIVDLVHSRRILSAYAAHENKKDLVILSTQHSHNTRRPIEVLDKAHDFIMNAF